VTTIRNTARDSAGVAVANCPVRVALVAGPAGTEPGYTADGTVIARHSLVADATGLWSIDLPANTTITPTGSYYIAAEMPPGQPPAITAFDVPAAGGPYWLSARMIGVPASPASLYIAVTQRGVAGGVATLDGAGQVPLSQLGNAPSGGGGTPAGTVTTETTYGQASNPGAASTFSRGDHTHGTQALPTPAAIGAVPTSQLGVNSGVATLDSGGKLTAAQIPAISIVSYLGAVGSQAAMLALVGQQGDWCTRTDLGTTWVISGADPTQLSSWTQLSYPTAPVISVNALTGAVTLSASDVGAVPTSRQVISGTGLTGGGDLTANRTLAVTYGTGAGTAAQGNDTRIANAVQTTDYAAFTDLGSLVNTTFGTVHAQSRNEPGTVTRLQGSLVVGAGGILANTTFATIAAGSRPTVALSISLRVAGSGANNFLIINTDGTVQHKAALVAADVLQFDGITYVHA
jgi:hypothetical protein